MDEQWRKIPGLDSRYRISDQGRLMGLTGRLLNPSKGHRDGYLSTRARAYDGAIVTAFVHVMVTEAFHGPRPKGHMVRHRNGNLLDNRAENVLWGSRSQNTYDSVEHGTHNNARKTHCKRGHPFSGENLIITHNGKRRCRECHRAGQRRHPGERRYPVRTILPLKKRHETPPE